MEIHGIYDPWLVALSFVVACAAAYAALRLAGSAKDGDLPVSPTLQHVAAAAVVLGSGIWTMHFVGMLAFSLPGMTITYRLDLTVLSLLIAVAFTGIGFTTLHNARGLGESHVLAGIPMGIGILTMHYLGMAAMKGEMDLHYDVWLVILSAVIAITASIAALWLTTRPGRIARRGLSAVVMGMAICGMHYTGMKAARFHMPEPDFSAPD
ncbi:hypothetical protein H7F51_17160 [Novosphingobium flavum]|uniref:MHYT domain-containing protein n=1 Tax=Novosphingobium flavum TaxID=1778672 RepID=A0A7X1FUK2_9SPHN|nr:MHYT domain-containing protein [Novosphingobium flavum]MBC2667251.1 hypothetical protein [Novosphingobium flavum]